MSNGRENRGSPTPKPTRDSGARISEPVESSRHRVGLPPMPPSYFAPAGRAARETLLESIGQVAQSQVVSALLRSSTAMMCILNECRQILAINAAYLDGLKVDNADDILGLRLGEAIHCVYSDEHPAGCGTGPHCRTCGAAIAIVAAQRTGKPVQRECMISARDRRGHSHDYSFVVRASPCVEERERLLVLSLSDVSTQKLHAGLERAFLHDISNVVGALSATTEMLKLATPTEAELLVGDLGELTQRLARELLIQKLLLSDSPAQYRQDWQKVGIEDTLRNMSRLFANHPVASSRELIIERTLQVHELTTDPSLLERVLTNMVTNALEASSAGQLVRLIASSSPEFVLFSVWNAGGMSDAVASRVFQRFYSTKKGLGRGQGTYAMKLIGETLLRGKVEFTTSPEAGTTFTITLPIEAKNAQ